jgi:hypothetical protein
MSDDLILAEIARLRAMGQTPFRKGVIEGLRSRAGVGARPACPYLNACSASQWSEGFERGMFGDLPGAAA